MKMEDGVDEGEEEDEGEEQDEEAHLGVNVGLPLLDGLEGRRSGHVKHDEGAHGFLGG